MPIQMSIRTYLLIWFFAVALATTISSTSTLAAVPSQSLSIDGLVVDQASAAVANAEVILISSSSTRKTLTDTSGHFHFDSPAKEILTLVITAKGFARVTRKISP